MIPVFTKYSTCKDSVPQYLFVYSQEDVSTNHPPMQTEVENLEELHIENEQEPCPCNVSDGIQEIIEDTKKVLKMLGFQKELDLVDKFSSTGEVFFLKEAISLTEKSDPVSSHKMKKILKNL